MTKGIKKQLIKAGLKVGKEIEDNSREGSFASGLASEGYAGGYAQALEDVMLALNGVNPNTRYWR